LGIPIYQGRIKSNRLLGSLWRQCGRCPEKG
jgi:hypothetical protein